MNDNKLIAEFMGLPEQNNAYENPYSGEYVEAIELSYDESWDWLMPVVDKINGFTDDEGEFLYEVEINPSRCIISSNEPAINARGLSTIVDQPNGEDMKQMVYIAVVQFINKIN